MSAREEMLRSAPAEIQAVWDLYTHANEAGRVVLALESADVEEARAALASQPFVQMHLIDFDFIPLAPFFGLEHLGQVAH